MKPPLELAVLSMVKKDNLTVDFYCAKWAGEVWQSSLPQNSFCRSHFNMGSEAAMPTLRLLLGASDPPKATHVAVNGVRGVKLGDVALERVAGSTSVLKSTAIASSAAASAVSRSAKHSGVPPRETPGPDNEQCKQDTEPRLTTFSTDKAQGRATPWEPRRPAERGDLHAAKLTLGQHGSSTRSLRHDC